MGKTSKQTLEDSANTSTNPTNKVKRTRKSVPRDSPPRRSSIYRGVTRLYNHILWFIFLYCSVISSSVDSFLCVFCSGIDGLDVMRLICGIKTAGMNRRTRKEDKVTHLIFLLLVPFHPSLQISHRLSDITFHVLGTVLGFDFNGVILVEFNRIQCI